LSCPKSLITKKKRGEIERKTLGGPGPKEAGTSAEKSKEKKEDIRKTEGKIGFGKIKERDFLSDFDRKGGNWAKAKKQGRLRDKKIERRSSRRFSKLGRLYK